MADVNLGLVVIRCVRIFALFVLQDGAFWHANLLTCTSVLLKPIRGRGELLSLPVKRIDFLGTSVAKQKR